MIDTLIFLLVLLPLACTISWYINETHEINLHKREMEQLWDLYAKESTLPGNDEPPIGLSHRPSPSWSPETKSRWKLYKQRNNL